MRETSQKLTEMIQIVKWTL